MRIKFNEFFETLGVGELFCWCGEIEKKVDDTTVCTLGKVKDDGSWSRVTGLDTRDANAGGNYANSSLYRFTAFKVGDAVMRKDGARRILAVHSVATDGYVLADNAFSGVRDAGYDLYLVGRGEVGYQVPKQYTVSDLSRFSTFRDYVARTEKDALSMYAEDIYDGAVSFTKSSDADADISVTEGITDTYTLYKKVVSDKEPTLCVNESCMELYVEEETPLRATTKDTNPKHIAADAKTRYSLIPKEALEGVCRSLQNGADKYGEFNWRTEGTRTTVYTNAAMRHIVAFVNGEDTDADSGESHLSQAIAGLLILHDSMIRGVNNDDRHQDH